jgi:hypothetical protein
MQAALSRNQKDDPLAIAISMTTTGSIANQTAPRSPGLKMEWDPAERCT